MSRNFENGSENSQINRQPEVASGNRTSLLTAGISAAGGALCLYAFTRRAKTSAALAAAGLFAMAQASRRTDPARYEAHASFAINCSPQEAYRVWRDFEKLPRFMQYLESVEVTDHIHSEWTAVGPLNAKLHWTAEIIEERENERIAWRSLEGSDVETSGSIEFRPGASGKGTLAIARVEYLPPAGVLGKTFASIMGKDPQFTVKEDLRRFKALVEAGEVPTTVGQSHGPRGLRGRAEQMLLREDQNVAPPQARTSMAQAG